MVDGRRVLALLGDDGGVVAYLTLPPGSRPRSYSRDVWGSAARGDTTNCSARRLILVKDIEPLVLKP